MLIEVGLFTVGLILLYFGAEYLVGGSSAIALRLGIAPLMVGLTVVAFGTSAPELLVSLTAVLSGSDDISVGNIIGSNIANIALILGLSAMFRPIEVSKRAVKREFPFMVGAALLMTLFVYTGSELVWWEGVIFLACMVFYLYYCFLSATSKSQVAAEAAAEEEALAAEGEEFDELEDIEQPDPDANPVLDVVKMVGGMAGLAGGAHLMVTSATTIALEFGVSELVIGITVVAFGTSLPELATSVVAAIRDESDISVGNVIGSNIFNIFLVLGIISVITSIAVGADALEWDIWIMVGVAIGIWPILRTGHRVSRLEGFFMFAFYCGYVAFLFLRS
jgi:cation:H+ antiporter